jgi:predicted ATPase/DNA-binding NarL/FixJ family response regulator
LCGPGLPADFPPLRALDRRLTNLPLQISSFVGRIEELAHTIELLRDRRLLTLAGAGGAGKTRLAVQLAAEVLDDFGDGVWFADLAPVNDPDLVTRTVAAAAGVNELPGRPVIESVVDRFIDATALVVLDNCEHLLEAATDVVETLLHRCPGVRVLATSREPLGADGEATFRVPSLGLPASESDSACESVVLFADRAALARPTLRVGPAEVAAMTRICARLDGIPLAIELAAARCRAMTPTQIADRLGRHFDLLTGGSRRALPRHRALDASVEWSYDLLTDEERALLRKLSVFAGGFTLEAAESVGADNDGGSWSVLEHLAGLVDKSLVQHDETGRYRLLETVRQFAESRLVDAGESEGARRRHAETYLALGTALSDDLYGPGAARCLRIVESELDNLRAADDWTVTAGETDLGLRLLLSLDLFWQLRVVEALERLGRLLDLPDAQPQTRLAGLSMGAVLECTAGGFARMSRWTQEALTLVDEHTDPELHGYLLSYAAWAGFFDDDPRVPNLLIEGLTRLRGTQRPQMRFALCDSLSVAALIAHSQGRDADLREIMTEMTQSAQDSGNPVIVGRSLLFHAFFGALRGDLTEAARSAAAMETRLTPVGDEYAVLIGAGPRGLAECLSQADITAARVLVERLATARTQNHFFSLTWGSLALAILATHGYHDGWRAPVDEADALGAATGFLWISGWAQALRARNVLRAGDVVAARAAAEAAAATVASNSRAELARGPAELAMALVLRAENQPAEAEASVHRALTTLVNSGLMMDQICALELLAGLASAQGSPAEAVRLLAAAEGARIRIGYPASPADAASIATERERLAAVLDAATVRTAHAEGAAMNWAEALAYASRGRGPRKRPTTGWSSLTPTESEVVALLATGLRNPEIAGRLCISPETVKTHVRNVFGKLGVSNRTELAALAARRD